ncbi:MAG: virion core protein (lumpy skin disease virus) [Ardenticatenia bacterium]|jgi:excisionase family DNA binding protein|nr:MAG: virion core protein (lumpy skin disease virus) [Ardenticatenia bacterium]
MARIIDVIEAPDQQRNQMVVRVPEVGAGDFRLGSAIIVRESQAAVFYRDGKALDVFGPGRHQITTANLPLLSSLLRLATGGNDLFTAEVYFVNMIEFTDWKWGTQEPVTLRDPDFGVVRVRAFGNYSVQISDPQLFVTKIVGTGGGYQTSQIQDFLRGIIVARFADVLGESKVPVLDLPSMQDEMAAAMRSKLSDEFDSFGLALKTFFLQNISLPEEVQKAIDQRAAMGAIGNMQQFMQYQAAQAVRDAAQQEGGGGLAGAGVGLGAGAGLGAVLGQTMAQSMQPPQPGQQSGAAAVPEVMTLSEAAAYMRVGEQDVLDAINSGQLKAKKIGTSYRISKQAIDEFLKS